MIFLDHNSTTPMLPEVSAAMLEVEQNGFGNPSSAHSLGRIARRYLEEAREGIAQLLGAQPSELLFTSGATESNNLALFGLATPGRDILAAPFEHPCVIEPLKQLDQRGCPVRWLPVSPRGTVLTAEVLAQIRPETQLIALMLANHETGAIQPVRHVAKTRPKDVWLHCDAAQAVGKIPVNFHDLGVSTLSFSGHKIGGPKGIGGLLIRTGVKLRPQLFGGHQQKGFRPGTEPVALIVGLHRALELRHQHLNQNLKRLREIRADVWKQLSEAVPPVVLNGPEIDAEDALPTTLNVSFPGCRSDLLLVSLDLAGVACSTGSACSSGSLLPSPVLQAMQITDDVLRSAIRLSFSASLSQIAIDEAIIRIIRAVRNARHPR